MQPVFQHDPLTNKIYDLAEAKIMILYPLPQGERWSAEGAALSHLPLGGGEWNFNILA
jgi:hypothetical protein